MISPAEDAQDIISIFGFGHDGYGKWTFAGRRSKQWKYVLQEKNNLLQTNRGEGGEELKQDPGVVPSVLHQPTFSLNRFLSVHFHRL